jgi:hypothetical protein
MNKPSTQTNKTPAPPVSPAHPEVPAIDAPVMSLEDAMNITNSEGVLYGNIPTEKLAIMSNSLTKALKSNPMSVDERAERERKHQAIGIILANREAKQ